MGQPLQKGCGAASAIVRPQRARRRKRTCQQGVTSRRVMRCCPRARVSQFRVSSNAPDCAREIELSVGDAATVSARFQRSASTCERASKRLAFGAEASIRAGPHAADPERRARPRRRRLVATPRRPSSTGAPWTDPARPRSPSVCELVTPARRTRARRRHAEDAARVIIPLAELRALGEFSIGVAPRWAWTGRGRGRSVPSRAREARPREVARTPGPLARHLPDAALNHATAPFAPSCRHGDAAHVPLDAYAVASFGGTSVQRW